LHHAENMCFASIFDIREKNPSFYRANEVSEKSNKLHHNPRNLFIKQFSLQGNKPFINKGKNTCWQMTNQILEVE